MSSAGIGIEILVAGEGKYYPRAGDSCTMHYVGFRPDGTEFDSTRKRGKPFTFTLGEEQVIEGLDIAVSNLSVGDTATVIIPANKAYGRRGFPGLIPPNSTLTFEIELLSVRT